jgi:IS30 family transposase
MQQFLREHSPLHLRPASSTKDHRWRRCLPRSKRREASEQEGGEGSPNFIERRVPMANRSVEASDRKTCSHWEADLVMFAKHWQGRHAGEPV